MTTLPETLATESERPQPALEDSEPARVSRKRYFVVA